MTMQTRGVHLSRLAEAALDRLGDNPSLWFDGTWHSSGRQHERVTHVAGGLRALGIEPGDRIVVMAMNCPEIPVVYHAAWRAGAVVTPVVFLLSAAELAHIVSDSGAKLLFTTPELLPKAREAAGAARIVVIGPAEADAIPFAELESAAGSSIVDRSADELAALLYTGGTTGRSKGVMLTHRNLAEAGWSSRQVNYVPGHNRVILSLPLSHSFGMLVTVSGMHANEPLATVLQRYFEPTSWLKLAVEHRSQVALMVPSMLAILLAQPLEQFDLSEFRYIFSGAAPLPAAIAEEFERRVPSVRIQEGYGCTETAGIITSTPPAARKPGTVGKPAPNVEVRIAESGEILVRGPNVMPGYWGEASHDAFDDAWFRTGDVGRFDEDGYLTIVDRIKDLIIRGGYNVYPRDVEEVLAAHPAVAMAAVVGRPDDRLGEEVVAFVSLHQGASATEEELIAFCRERLAAHKYPRQVAILEAIPLTSVGKLDRKRLRAEVIAQART